MSSHSAPFLSSYLSDELPHDSVLGLSTEALIAHTETAIAEKHYTVAEQYLVRLFENAPEQAQTWYLKAQLNLARRRPKSCLTALDQCLRINPQHLAAHKLKATSLHEVEGPYVALRYTQALLEEHRHDSQLYGLLESLFTSLHQAENALSARAQGLVVQAQNAFAENNLEATLLAIDRALQGKPHHEPALLIRSKLMLWHQQPDEAKAILDGLVALQAYPVDSHLLKANIAEQDGNPRQALVEYRRVLSNDPQQIDALRAIAHAFDTAQAMEAKQEICEQYPFDVIETLHDINELASLKQQADQVSQLPVGRAATLDNTLDNEQTCQILDRALRNHDDEIVLDIVSCYAGERARLYEARALAGAGTLSLAREATNQLIKDYPQSSEGRLIRGAILVRQQQWQLACEDFDLAWQTAPNQFDAASDYHYAQALTQCQRWQDAAVQIHRVLSANPSHRGALRLNADLLIHEGRVGDGLAILLRLLKQTPKDVDLLVCSADCYATLQRYPEALSHISQAIAEQPNTAHYYRRQARWYLATDDMANALQVAQQACAIDRQSADTLSLLGEIYFRQARYTIALGFFHHALKLGKEDPELLLIAYCHYWGKEWPAALNFFKRFLAIHGDHVSALCMTGEVHCAEGRFAQAQHYFDSALALKPESTRVQHLCIVNANLVGDYQRTIALSEVIDFRFEDRRCGYDIPGSTIRCEYLMPLPDIRSEVASAYCHFSRWDDVIALCRDQDIDDTSSNPQLLAYACVAYAELGQPETAERYRQAAIKAADAQQQSLELPELRQFKRPFYRKLSDWLREPSPH